MPSRHLTPGGEVGVDVGSAVEEIASHRPRSGRQPEPQKSSPKPQKCSSEQQRPSAQRWPYKHLSGGGGVGVEVGSAVVDSIG
jgi:hypothetical protein